jgi:hypothetical protein
MDEFWSFQATLAPPPHGAKNRPETLSAVPAAAG